MDQSTSTMPYGYPLRLSTGRFCCRISLSIAGIIAGLCGGFVLASQFGNIDSGVFGVFSALVALVVTIVHFRFQWGAMATWSPSTVRAVMLSGCLCQLVGVVTFVVYLTLGCLQQTDQFIVHGRSYFITIVWCFMTWKWGFLLFLYTRSYRNRMAMAAEEVKPLMTN